jgi:hypothetical protein
MHEAAGQRAGVLAALENRNAGGKRGLVLGAADRPQLMAS